MICVARDFANYTAGHTSIVVARGPLILDHAWACLAWAADFVELLAARVADVVVTAQTILARRVLTRATSFPPAPRCAHWHTLTGHVHAREQHDADWQS
jgi:hypothetical protein